MITCPSSLSSGQEFITTTQLQRRMQLVEKNTDKRVEPAQISFEENEQKQESDDDISTVKEGGENHPVMNEMAEEDNGGEKRLII